MTEGKNYINGKFTTEAKTFTSYNPSTEEAIGEFPETSSKTVNEVVSVAREKFNIWRKLSRINRAEYFYRLVQVVTDNSKELINAISLDTGKSLNESLAEVNESIHMAQYTFAQGREPFGKVIASEIADKDVSVFRKPKGVVAVISPFNFCAAIGGFWTSAPALLEGNTVVLKPSEDAPYTSQVIAELYHKAGFPPGVFNVVHGMGETTGDALVKSDVNHICFTGSAKVGQIIRRHCAEVFNKSASCEMGSKSALIIFNDANLDMAVKAGIASAFKLSGQRCVSAGRIIIQRSVYKEFCQRFTTAAKKLVVGDPYENPSPDFGPLINKKQLERVVKYNEMTKGTTDIFLEGKRLNRKGYYLTPHVYGCEWTPSDKMPFLQDEVFGPSTVLVPFDTVEDAVRIYNDTKYGLSLAVMTNDMKIIRKMREDCDFGMMYVNAGTIGSESHLNFQGIKASGSGGGTAAGTFLSTTHEVTITINNDNEIKWAQGMR